MTGLSAATPGSGTASVTPVTDQGAITACCPYTAGRDQQRGRPVDGRGVATVAGIGERFGEIDALMVGATSAAPGQQ